MKMKIALTGATGFVGRAVTSLLVTQGHAVSALVRSPAAAERLGSVRLVKGDLDSVDALTELVAGADAVVHVAGAVAAPSRSAFFAANERGTRNLLTACTAVSIKRFVHISTLSAKRPGLTAYGASKAAGEAAVSQATEIEQRLIIRPPAVYGPGDLATLPLVKALTNSPVVLAGHSKSRFSLIYVDDLARIIADAAQGAQTGTREVDDGKAGGYSWHDLVTIASQIEGRRLTPHFLPKAASLMIATAAEGISRISGRPGMVTRDKIRELYMPDWLASPPGWPLVESVQFKAGLQKTLGWYREAGWLPPRRRANVPQPQDQ